MRKIIIASMCFVSGCTAISTTLNSVDVTPLPKKPVESYSEVYNVGVGQSLPDNVSYTVANDIGLIVGEHQTTLIYEGKSYPLKFTNHEQLPVVGRVSKEHLPFEAMEDFTGKLAIIPDHPTIPGVEAIGMLLSGNFYQKTNQHAGNFYFVKTQSDHQWRYIIQVGVFKDFNFSFVPANKETKTVDLGFAKLIEIDSQNNVSFSCNGLIHTRESVTSGTEFLPCSSSVPIQVDQIATYGMNYRFVLPKPNVFLW